jgi:hypothetical protein
MNNSARIYIDSSDEGLSTNVQISTTGGNQLINGIHKIGVSNFGYMDTIPNIVTGVNDTLIFQVDGNGGGEWSIVIPPALYVNAVSLFREITVRMIVASSFYFDWDEGQLGTPFPNSEGWVSSIRMICSEDDNTVAGGPGNRRAFRFVGGNLLSAAGAPVLNLPDTEDFKTQMLIGYMGMLYTRFVDIRSSIITSYQKNSNSNNGFSGSDLLYRHYFTPGYSSVEKDKFLYSVLPDPDDPKTITILGVVREVKWNSIEIKNPTYLNYEFSRNVNSIDVSLYDQFGKTLEVGKNFNNSNGFNGFFWNITLITQGE